MDLEDENIVEKLRGAVRWELVDGNGRNVKLGGGVDREWERVRVSRPKDTREAYQNGRTFVYRSWNCDSGK